LRIYVTGLIVERFKGEMMTKLKMSDLGDFSF
jgi:hypothetical protein